MRLVAVEDLQKGDVLGRSVFNTAGRCLVPAGFALSDRHLMRLSKAGLGRQPAMDLEKGIRPPGVFVRKMVEQRIALSLDEDVLPPLETVAPAWTEDAIHERLMAHPAWGAIATETPNLSQIIETLHEAARQQVPTLLALPELPDEAHLIRAVDVGCLAMLLADRYGYPKRDRHCLAVAALVHDFGRILFSEMLDHAELPGELDRVLAREHPTFTAMMLIGADPEAEQEHQIVWQQAERHNGRGLPRGIRGDGEPPRAQRHSGRATILPHAELLTLAIEAERLRAGENGDPYPLQELVEQLLGGEEPAFHPDAFETLCLLLQRFPVGSRVRIKSNSSGRYLGFSGIIREAWEDGESHPVKQIYLTHDPQGQAIDAVTVDLSGEKRLQLLWQS